MRIEIDGTPFEKPHYIQGLEDNDYIRQLTTTPRYASSVQQHLSADPLYSEYVAAVLRNGRNYVGIELASAVADQLSDKGEVLEIIAPRGQRVFDEGLVEGWSERVSGDLDYNAPMLGSFLRRGTLVFRGNVGKVSSVRGGTLYVDGDVNQITQCDEGIVYVNGDVNLIGRSEKSVIIVAGQVKRYEEPRRSSGGLGREVTPSPFIFTTHALDRKIPDDFRGSDTRLLEGIVPPISSSHVVSEERLKGWDPEETRGKALELCVERINSYLENLKDMAAGIADATTMARFARYNMYGYIEGLRLGYYRGMNDALPNSD